MKSQSPHISVNKLGEFLVSTSKKQRSILKGFKYPNENKFTYTAHQDAREAIKNYLINDFDEDIILDCIEHLKTKQDVTDHQKKIDKSSMRILRKVLKSKNINTDYSYESYNGDNPKINIKGVEISVYPDLIIKHTSRKKNYTGALKLHLSTTSNISIEGDKYIAAILNYFSENYFVSDDEIKPKYNIAYDAPKDNFIECPSSVQRRWEDIEAGCLNIAAIWDTITP